MKENIILSNEEILEGQRAVSDMKSIREGATFNREEGILEFTEEQKEKAKEEMSDEFLLDKYKKLPQADKQKIKDYFEKKQEKKNQCDSIFRKIRLLQEKLEKAEEELRSDYSRASQSKIFQDFGFTKLEKIIAEEEK